MTIQTNEQKAATEALRALAGPGRYRVELDAEGWPVILGRSGRVEYHDGYDLAVWFEARLRCQGMVTRFETAGCRRHQIGDTEARLLFAPGLLPTIARMITARTTGRRTGRTPEQMARVRALSPIGRGIAA